MWYIHFERGFTVYLRLALTLDPPASATPVLGLQVFTTMSSNGNWIFISSFLVLFWWCGQGLSLWQALVQFKPSLGEGSPFAEPMICISRSGSGQGTVEHWPFCVVRKHIILGCWRGTMTLSTPRFSLFDPTVWQGSTLLEVSLLLST